MNDKLPMLLERIHQLEQELLAEIHKTEAQFSYELRDKKAHFTAAIALKTRHSRYAHFLDFGDAEQYRQRIEQVRRDFTDLQKEE